MHHRTRRAHRAIGSIALLAAVAGGVSLAAPDSASAAPKPRVTVRVRDRVLVVDGGRASDVIALRVPAAAPFALVVDLGNDGTADATVHRSRFDSVVVRGNEGDDVILIDETQGVALPFTDTVPTTMRGDAGNDTLLGGLGAEDMRGGAGNDIVDGNKGNDVASLDAGDDEFIWDPGDGSDTIEGRGGQDLMTFNGAGGNEHFVAADNSGRLRFTRDVGNIVMDTDGVERVAVNALGGSDFVEIKDLRRTDVTSVDVDGGVTLGAAGADGIVDSVFVDGTERADAITLAGSAGSVSIQGLAATVNLTDFETLDRLLVSSLGGRDVIDASQLGADTMHLDVLSGEGDDVVLGGAGADGIIAGRGRDVVDGNRGNDNAALDEGDDEFIWDPGDGSDIVEGAAGFDRMTFNGSSGNEVFAATANGERLAFTRDLGNIFMDTNDVEQVDLNALGGADQLTVGDLTGTDVTVLDANLAAAIGAVGGDGAIDSITVQGTPGDDIATISGAAGTVQVIGLPSSLDIANAEPTDTLTIAGNGGTDSFDSTGLAPGTIQLSIV